LDRVLGFIGQEFCRAGTGNSEVIHSVGISYTLFPGTFMKNYDENAETAFSMIKNPGFNVEKIYISAFFFSQYEIKLILIS